MSSPFAYQATAGTDVVAERTYLRQVFAWMLLGLALTTGVAIYLASTSNVTDYFVEHRAAMLDPLRRAVRRRHLALRRRSSASRRTPRRCCSASTPA